MPELLSYLKPKYVVVCTFLLFFFTGCIFLYFLSVQTQMTSISLDPSARAGHADLKQVSIFLPYDIDLRTYYEQESGFGSPSTGITGAPDSFGAYYLLPVGEKLYLALGQYPAQKDGALVATFETSNTTLEKIKITNTDGNRIEEQGIHMLVYDQNTNSIVFPGTDPLASWDLGNFYALDLTTNSGFKHRENANLREVVHGWGLTIDPAGNYYYGTGSYLNQVPFSNSAVTAGEVFQSTDKGVSWQRKTIDPNLATAPNSFLSSFRVYSLAWLENKLFAANSESNVWWSTNQGDSWTKIPDLIIDPVLTLLTLNLGQTTVDSLFAFSTDGRSVVKINSDSSYQFFYVPFKLMTGAYNLQKITTDGEWIYVISDDVENFQNLIYRSKNLYDWFLVGALPSYDPVSGGKAISLTYWPYHQELVIGTDGLNAGLHHINISSIPVINITPIPSSTPTPTMIPSVCLPCNDPRYDTNNDGQISQDDVQFLMSNCLGRPYSTICPDLNQSGNIFLSGDLLCAVNCINQNPLPSPNPTEFISVTPTLTPTPTTLPTVSVPPLPTASPRPISSDLNCSQLTLNPTRMNLSAGSGNKITLQPGFSIGDVNYLPRSGDAYWSRIVKEERVICSSYYIGSSYSQAERLLKLSVSRQNTNGCTLAANNDYSVQTLVVRNGQTYKCPVGIISVN